MEEKKEINRGLEALDIAISGLATRVEGHLFNVTEKARKPSADGHKSIWKLCEMTRFRQLELEKYKMCPIATDLLRLK